jgi:hypothetical protein
MSLSMLHACEHHCMLVCNIYVHVNLVHTQQHYIANMHPHVRRYSTFHNGVHAHVCQTVDMPVHTTLCEPLSHMNFMLDVHLNARECLVCMRSWALLVHYKDSLP